MYQAAVAGTWQTTPLVVDGIMYLTQRPNDVVALDAKTGPRLLDLPAHARRRTQIVCCGANNRGLAILGDTLFMGTLDAHLVAIDAKTRPSAVEHAGRREQGRLLADARAARRQGQGDRRRRRRRVRHSRLRRRVRRANAAGKSWRFYTIPGAGRAGRRDVGAVSAATPATFCDPEAWKHGGGSIWVTGSYDPELNLTYWGVGNAGPDWNDEQRPGDNLYTDSVVALDADTGRLKWHYQFTPHDRYDYDSVQIPVLADITWSGAPLKAMLWANRNGNFYVLERATGKIPRRQAVREGELDGARSTSAAGRIQTPQPPGQPTWPGNQGGTNWYSPSYSPRTGLFYVSGVGEATRRSSAARRSSTRKGGTSAAASTGRTCRCRARRRSRAAARPDQQLDRGGRDRRRAGARCDQTGELKWKFAMTDVTDSGILTTASDLLFTGGREGYFQALDARTGTLLWKASLGAQIVSGPITYEVDGKQYVATISGLSLCVFALRE